MLKTGHYNELVVERATEHGLYLNPKADEVLLPSKYVPQNTRPGDTLRVFVYHDSNDRLVATTLEPKAVVGEFAYLKVKDTTSFGVFMDWGLEKDLLIPKSEQQDKMFPGRKYVVKVCIDPRTGRVYGTTRISQHCEKAVTHLSEGEKVGLLIYAITKIGIMAVINNQYSGMLYRNETFEKLAIGEQRQGYVSRIREAGKIDLTLKEPGHGSIGDSSTRVMEILDKWDGFVPCHDKSPPEDITHIFSMSKKEFKRATGRLYKQGKITLTGKGIQIKK